MNSITGHAQFSMSDSLVQFTGQLIDAKTERPVFFAHVVNMVDRKGTISDTLGYFYLPIVKSDTIIFSTIGYKKTRICLLDSTVNDNKYFTKIRLEPKTYELSRVDIYELRWQAFKEEFTEIELPDDEAAYEPGGAKWFEALFYEKDLEEIRNPVPETGIIIKIKSKQDKIREKLKEIQRQEELDKIADAKISSLTTAYTKLIGDELFHFINFCNFNRLFILTANDYDIVAMVKKRFLQYQKLKSEAMGN